MRFLIVLDARSATGSVYSKGDADGFVVDGELTHPVIECDDIALDGPNYLEARRASAPTHLTLCIPHASVIAIVAQAAGEPDPLRVVPASAVRRGD